MDLVEKEFVEAKFVKRNSINFKFISKQGRVVAWVGGARFFLFSLFVLFLFFPQRIFSNGRDQTVVFPTDPPGWPASPAHLRYCSRSSGAINVGVYSNM